MVVLAFSPRDASRIARAAPHPTPYADGAFNPEQSIG
jgi:hypothetical protein